VKFLRRKQTTDWRRKLRALPVSERGVVVEHKRKDRPVGEGAGEGRGRVVLTLPRSTGMSGTTEYTHSEHKPLTEHYGHLKPTQLIALKALLALGLGTR
jgi:hypothetical protein